MILPTPPDLGLLLVRTDYSDDSAWRQAVEAATAVHPDDDFDRMGAALRTVESPELADLPVEDLVRLPRSDDLMALAVADSQTMQDQTILFVDLDEEYGQPGRSFRAVPREVEPIVANLAIANMDFSEFADNTDDDGVFRSF